LAEAGAGPAIHAQDLAKSYGEVVALAGLTMTVARGEVFGFLGPNGAGKTTAVKLLLGLTRPSGGQAWVLGAPAGDLAARRRIGYLPELFRYQSFLSAREVLAFHAELAGIERAIRTREIARVLDLVGLARRAGDRVGGFSKGMQQRLGLAVALLGAPELVFLDEPTSALDPVGRHEVREVIRGLRDHGTTVFLNSHLLSEVELVCDRVAVVDRGRVIASGDIEEITSGKDVVRIRLDGLDGRVAKTLSAFGAASEDGAGWWTVHGTLEAQVPELVAAVVGAGGRVYAVEPGRRTLEDRFLELLRLEEEA
jgi:ABC-2 type transport system ATP-binding protein